MRRSVMLVVGFHLLSAFAAAAHTLLLVSSDQHCFTGRLPLKIKTQSKLTTDFLRKYPDGTVVDVNVGDLIGKQAKWTTFAAGNISSDYGKIELDVRLLMAKDAGARRWMVDAVGNHEEFDWSPGRGQMLFHRNRLSYLRDLSAIKNQEVKLVAANVIPGFKGRELFGPYMDVPLGKRGEVMRFIGLTMNRFFNKSTYNPEDPFDLIRDIAPMVEAAKEQLKQAEKDGVERIVFAIHEEIEFVEPLMQEIDSWRSKQSPFLRRVPLNLWLLGHDHTPKVKRSGKRRWLQSGSNHDLARIVLNDDMEIVGDVRLYGEKEQRELVETSNIELRPYEQIALKLVEDRVTELRAQLSSRPLVFIDGFQVKKIDMKRERQELGTRIAETLRAYGQRQTEQFSPDIEVQDDVAFFNSPSYRLDYHLPRGPLTLDDILEIYPYSTSEDVDYTVGVFMVTGLELQELYSSLRRHRIPQKVYTPQMSMNLREEGTELGLQIFRDGKWQALDPQGYYRLTMDPWLSQNGENLDSWNPILFRSAENKPAVHDPFVPIMEANAALFACPKILAHFREHNLKVPAIPVASPPPDSTPGGDGVVLVKVAQ